MKREIISKLHSSFELAVNQNDDVEFWFARDLQVLLGYVQWRNFVLVIDKAKTACANAKQDVLDHFAEVSKMVDVGSGAKRETDDVILTRYACYLIAQNVLYILRFYVAYPKWQTVSAILSWSHFIVLLGVLDETVRKF